MKLHLRSDESLPQTRPAERVEPDPGVFESQEDENDVEHHREIEEENHEGSWGRERKHVGDYHQGNQVAGHYDDRAHHRRLHGSFESGVGNLGDLGGFGNDSASEDQEGPREEGENENLGGDLGEDGDDERLHAARPPNAPEPRGPVAGWRHEHDRDGGSPNEQQEQGEPAERGVQFEGLQDFLAGVEHVLPSPQEQVDGQVAEVVDANADVESDFAHDVTVHVITRHPAHYGDRLCGRDFQYDQNGRCFCQPH